MGGAPRGPLRAAARDVRLTTPYGGSVLARWDGKTLWGPDLSPAQVMAEATRLDAVLQALPALPPGFDGWWSVEEGR